MQDEPTTQRTPGTSGSSRLYLGLAALMVVAVVALVSSDLPWPMAASSPPAPRAPANLRVPLRVPAAPLFEPLAPTRHSEERAGAPESPVPADVPPTPLRAAGREASPVAAATPDATDGDAAADDAEDADLNDVDTLRKTALEATDPEERLIAVVKLSVSDDPSAIPVLVEALKDRDEDVRMTALESLADLTGEVPLQAIETALRDPSPDVRYQALELLAEVGGDAAHAAARRALDDPNADIRVLAETLLRAEARPMR